MTAYRQRFCKWASPIKMMAIAFLFCLPWIEVRCNLPGKMPVPTEYQAAVPDILATQSGVQIAFGKFTDLAQIKEKLEQSKQMAANARTKLGLEPKGTGNIYQLEQPFSWPMILSLISLVAACSISIVMPSGHRRAVCQIILLCITLLTLVFQCQSGFAIQNVIGEANTGLRSMAETGDRIRAQQGVPPQPNPSPFSIDWNYTPWFHATWMMLIVAIAFYLAEARLFSTPSAIFQSQQ